MSRAVAACSVSKDRSVFWAEEGSYTRYSFSPFSDSIGALLSHLVWASNRN